jgi:nitrile hydratase
MNGIHDLGGMHGFGPVAIPPREPVFHARWESRVLALVYQAIGDGWMNLDAFRHGIERMRPVDYLEQGYYGRWLDSLERVLGENGVLDRSRPAPPPKPHPGYARSLAAPPRFALGEAVRVRNRHVSGHTRAPRYVRGKRGVVVLQRGGYVYPDTQAHGAGEQPQHLYGVRFTGAELWGADAEPRSSVTIDLFEPYLEPAAS